MAEVVLDVEKREKLGKQGSKQLRRSGKIPGIFYMHGEQSIPITMDAKQLHNLIHTETSLVDLNFDSGDRRKCVIREIQWDPVNVRPLHVDLMGIKLTEKVQVAVPIHLVGNPAGVKLAGGILQQVIRELPIECLPMDIPEHIEVDVTNLNIGDTARVENISIDKVKILMDPSQTIAVVRPPKLVVETPVDAEAEITEPEVVSQKKEKEEEEPEKVEKTKKES